MIHASLKKYQQVNKSTAQEASPYQLVAMLFQKLLDNIATAKGAITQKNYEKKGAELSNAIAIIGVLEASIDFEQGGEISNNLASLYLYCSEQLLLASTNNDIDKLNEVAQILIPIKSGWDSIPLENHNQVSF
ncbi:flagellar export chaperone FliS [Colwellia sp. MB02u-18]|jgi:flagellar protein FliS|uniref:flagellar export chaperone FliS n=1 Tax=unclassified Colwellia TaxID=196834 RepID=UPI0015F65E85|nr:MULTISPECIES: flagellar export chaperone FliS [unclassified Colwellia]MBA6223188.1 flagellar export chaperone FliS [Colwellia sp. MB3u-45]MBA6265952.1 flagellar export chaperone FliS [Colwellia sp. MB3u-43]MBA6320261.1 flagellar export chaperone FliS [Colwellia sp. MB02u-19]MBA6323020.1 flagellar export chaperone FliS [Colwellia sp. MB02u-18]MBA6330353.1 flagellar export chaperone FliS [Colwellia sp. MB02u-12]